MSQSAAAPRSPWIISPAWDLLYIVATPLAIVPAVLLLERQVFTPAQIFLFVTAFATLGHHLPGFMRAYGDRDLFRRFRWRFLLVPPLALATALAFAPPPAVAARLDLPYDSLRGLELILLLWGTWHGLMQTFGFMRIYDMKRGIADARTARLDFWLCAMLFAAGMVFSDARVFGVMDAAWRSGLPIVGPEWLARARWLVGGGTILVAAAYVVNVVGQRSSQQGISWIKIALAATTGGLYWFSGQLSTNLVIGIAMFEIFHAVQYYAIVWVYNRRLAERVGGRFCLLGFLFRERWSMLGLYLAAIAAFGSIRYLAGPSDDLDTIARHATLFAILAAVFNASTLLHFYFDGFIWKVSERSTAANLDVAEAAGPFDRFVPGMRHAGKWLAFYALAGGLVYLQFRQARETRWAGQSEDARVYGALAQWAPHLPEAQLQSASLALDAANYEAAIDLASSAAAALPRSHEAHAKLGEIQLASHQFDAAVASFQRAIALDATRWRYHVALAQALERAGRQNEALAHLADAAKKLPGEPVLQQEYLARLQRMAARAYRTGDLPTARRHYEQLLAQSPTRHADRFLLGTIQLQQQDHAAAAATFTQLLTDTPNELKARMMLGNALAGLDKLEQAEKELRVALGDAANDGDIHYNLGLVLLKRNNVAEARRHIQRAEELGVQPSPEVAEAIR